MRITIYLKKKKENVEINDILNNITEDTFNVEDNSYYLQYSNFYDKLNYDKITGYIKDLLDRKDKGLGNERFMRRNKWRKLYVRKRTKTSSKTICRVLER